jgi:chromosome segregation ATPase
MQKQFDFVNSVNQTLDEAHQAIKNIRSINKKLSAFETNYGNLNEAKAILKTATDLKNEFSEIEKALYQTQNKSNQDPLNFPIRLTNKLGHINNLVMSSDFPPTDQDSEVSKLLTNQIKEQMKRYNKLVKEDLESFNKTFAALKLDYLTLK